MSAYLNYSSIHEHKGALQSCLAGAMGGMVSKSVTAPLERVKLLQQGGNGAKSVVSTIQVAFRQEGALGLWKGNGINLARVATNRALLFMCQDQYKQGIMSIIGESKRPNWVSFLSGSLAGVTANLVSYPLDLARTQMSGCIGKASSNKFSIVLTRNYSSNGIKGLYRGFSLCLGGAVVYEGTKFMMYDYISDHLRESNISRGLRSFAAGWVAGSIAHFITYPNDTLRRRIMIAQQNGIRMNWLVCMKQMIAKEGWISLFAGLQAQMIRAPLAAGLQFFVYESLIRWLRQQKQPLSPGFRMPAVQLSLV